MIRAVLGTTLSANTYDDTTVEDTAYNGGTCAGGSGQGNALGVQRRIAVIV